MMKLPTKNNEISRFRTWGLDKEFNREMSQSTFRNCKTGTMYSRTFKFKKRQDMSKIDLCIAHFSRFAFYPVAFYMHLYLSIFDFLLKYRPLHRCEFV